MQRPNTNLVRASEPPLAQSLQIVKASLRSSKQQTDAINQEANQLKLLADQKLNKLK